MSCFPNDRNLGFVSMQYAIIAKYLVNQTLHSQNCTSSYLATMVNGNDKQGLHCINYFYIAGTFWLWTEVIICDSSSLCWLAHNSHMPDWTRNSMEKCKNTKGNFIKSTSNQHTWNKHRNSVISCHWSTVLFYKSHFIPNQTRPCRWTLSTKASTLVLLNGGLNRYFGL